MSRMVVSIIGCGRVARDHCEAMRTLPNFDLASLVDREYDKAARLASECGAKRCHTDYRRVLEDREVQAVIVSAPTHLHFPITMEALASGKHVLVEKPMCETAAQAEEMVEAASRRGVILMVGHVMRFMPIFSQAKRLIAGGRLGRPIHALERRFCYRTEVFPWWTDTQGFLIAHHGSHSIDLFLWLLDSKPVRVYADASSNVPGYAGEDDFGLQMVLGNNAVVSMHHSFLSRVPAHDVLIIGAEATISVVCFSSLSLNGERIVQQEQREVVSTAFSLQLSAFFESVSKGREPISSGAEALLTMRAIDAARQSVQSHSVIDL